MFVGTGESEKMNERTSLTKIRDSKQRYKAGVLKYAQMGYWS
jgi:hypothetical protein